MLAVAGGKGGVGKTTTALALAATLARRRSPVRVVDTDCDMPDLHTMAGCARQPTLSAVLDGDRVPDQPVPSLSGVRVVPAPTAAVKTSVADALVALAARDSCQTVVDTPGGAGPEAVTPLRAVDSVLLVSDATPQSLSDCAKTAAMARELDARVVGVVLTATTTLPDGVSDLLDAPVLTAVPPARRPLDEAGVWAAYAEATQRLSRHTVI
ncbi:MinD/ParA family ATP-binding protein [Haloarchaeobius sp. DFWS5]|uniref:MinD/ParA family ATP-binding protein n=1 Tax=Haloarchaeobius sp. DFWS5 TaxID=3446114 RepID=UPI003EC0F353